jgi:hypothetical protein
MKAPLYFNLIFICYFVINVSPEDNARNSVVSCPLLHPVLDDVTRIDSAISLLAPRVLRCKVDYLLSDTRERDSCDSAEADLLAYQRFRSSIVERRHAYATRRIAGRSRSITRISPDKWSGEEFSTYYVNYTLRGTPSVLLGASILDGVAGDGTTSEEGESVKRFLDVLLLSCTTNGLDCRVPVDAIDEEKNKALSLLRRKLKIPGFLAGSNMLERLDSFLESINETSKYSTEGHFFASINSSTTLKDLKASAKSATDSWKHRFPVLISAESVPVNDAPATFHRILAPLTDKISVRLFDNTDLSLFYPRVNGSIPSNLDVFSLSQQHWDGIDPLVGSIIHSSMKPLQKSNEKINSVPYGCDIDEAHIDLIVRPGLDASDFVKRVHENSHVNSSVDPFETKSTCPFPFPSFLLANFWDAIVSPGEVLVIPSGFAASWHSTGSVNERKRVLTLDYGWLDASIISRVASSLITSIGAVIGKSEDAFLLDALESGLIDYRIDRLPPSLVDYFNNRTYPIPKATLNVTKRIIETASSPPLATSSEFKAPDVLTQLPDESEAQFRRRQRKSRALNNENSISSAPVDEVLFEKQRSISDVETRWDDLIKDISSPTPLNPIAIHWSRNNITLAWHVPPSLSTETFAVFWHGSPLSNEDSNEKAASAEAEFQKGVLEAESAVSRLSYSGRRLKEVIDNATSANLTIVDGSLIAAVEVNGTESDGSPSTTLHIISDGGLDFSSFIFNSQTAEQKAEASDNKLIAKRKLLEWEDKLDRDVEFAALQLRSIADRVHSQLESNHPNSEREQDSPSWRRHDFVHPLPGVADAWLRRQEALHASESDSPGSEAEKYARILHSSDVEKSRLKRRWDLSRKRALNTADRVLQLELDASTPTKTSSSMFLASGDGFSGRLISSTSPKQSRAKTFGMGNADQVRRLSFKPLHSVGIPSDDHTIRSSENVEWGCGVKSADDMACVTITGLIPSHAYTFRIAPVSEDGSVGSSSLPSPSVSTLPLSLSSPFSGPVTVDAIDATSVLISWAKVADIDFGGLPMIGVLIAREDLQEVTLNITSNIPGVFSHHVILPTSDIVASGHQARTRFSAELAHVSSGKITGLHPNRCYRFIAHPITALGVAPANEPSPVIKMPTLSTATGQGTGGRLLAVLAGSGRIARSSHAASPNSNVSFATYHGISSFDATSPLLHSAPEADRLAVIAQLHAAVTTAFSSIRKKTSFSTDVPHASTLLERSGLGAGALDVDNTLSSAARALQLDPQTAGLGHALGLWVGQSAVAHVRDSGVETVTSEADPEPTSLLPGFGGIHRYGDTIEKLRKQKKSNSSAGISLDAKSRNSKRRRRLAAVDPLSDQRQQTDDESPANPDWHQDIAYWAMATGKVSGIVSTLATAFDSTSSTAKGLICSNGFCSSPAALEIKRRQLREIDGDTNQANTGMFSPCISPLLIVRDRTQTLFLSNLDRTSENSKNSKSRSLLNSINLTIPSWACAFTPKSFDLEAEYVAAEPLGGFQGLKNVSFSTIFRNSHEFPGRTVLIERGAPYSFAEKATLAIAAGASAVIFVDDERMMCGTLSNIKFDQGCVKGGDKLRGVGFASTDSELLWAKARGVPILLITRDAGLALVNEING